MQHPDEGMIHSWLDGALDPATAARVEAHVAECPVCAAATAEARGFIAAASRVLTALDNAPRGVMPLPAPVKRHNQAMWRAAAVVLVIAGGSLVVFRSGNSPRPSLAVGGPGSGGSPGATPSREKPASRQQRSATQGGPVQPVIAAAAAKRNPAAGMSAGAAAGMPRETVALRVLRVEPGIGETRTIYDAGAGDTVTLIESAPASAADAALKTAASPARRARAERFPASPEARTETSMAIPPDTQPVGVRRGVGAAAIPGGAEAAYGISRTGTLSRINSIVWSEAGKSLALSGRVSVARLEQIKRRIERERTAAAAKRAP